MKPDVKEYYPERYHLIVNGIIVGDYIYGEKQWFKYPDEWAKRQVPKRIKVLERNMERLKSELLDCEYEHSQLKQWAEK